MNLYLQMGLDKIALDSNRRKHTLPRHAVRIVLKESDPEITYGDIAEMEGAVAGRYINTSTVIYSVLYTKRDAVLERYISEARALNLSRVTP
jgi:predicted transcriptional regulator